MKSFTVIVADGSFPVHEIPLGYLKIASRVICCDGSAESVVKAGFEPDAIVGDMDSLSKELKKRFAGRIFKDSNQDTNDLTKALTWCIKRNYTDIVIIGATGKREDHTIGNISLLTEYINDVNIIMVTDTGVFRPLRESAEISSFPGQQVSIFAIDPATELTSSGLRYPLQKTKVKNWWVATLNEATGEKFKLEFNDGRVIVYLKFPENDRNETVK
jgi:thiamine pyrophosphokinase